MARDPYDPAWPWTSAEKARILDLARNRSDEPRHTPAPKCADCGHFWETHDGFGCCAINCQCAAIEVTR